MKYKLLKNRGFNAANKIYFKCHNRRSPAGVANMPNLMDRGMAIILSLCGRFWFKFCRFLSLCRRFLSLRAAGLFCRACGLSLRACGLSLWACGLSLRGLWQNKYLATICHVCGRIGYNLLNPYFIFTSDNSNEQT